MASWREKVYQAVGMVPTEPAREPPRAPVKPAREPPRAPVRPVPRAREKTRLTDEQVQNWRRALCLTLGPYALVMPRETVQRLHDQLQEKLDETKP